jgi:hypothetical protein
MSDSAHSSPTFPTPRRTRKAQVCNMMMRPMLDNGLGHFDIGETERSIAEMTQNVCDALLHMDAVPELISTELFTLLVYQTIYRLAGAFLHSRDLSMQLTMSRRSVPVGKGT